MVPIAAVTAAVMTGQPPMINGAKTTTELMATLLFGKPAMAELPANLKLNLSTDFDRILRNPRRGPGAVHVPNRASGLILRSSFSTAAPDALRAAARISVSKSTLAEKASNSPETIASSISVPLKRVAYFCQPRQVESLGIAPALPQMDHEYLAALRVVAARST